jgi:hypothetical protein
MNWQKIYDQLIDNAKSRGAVDGYCEKHHIIPKSMGGSNDKTNLVNLTAREHFLAHFLLGKIHGGSQWHAIDRMRGGMMNINSRLYEIAKKEISKVASERFKGKARTIEVRKKISAGHIGVAISEEAKKKISASLKGRKFSKEAGYRSSLSKHIEGQQAWMN